MKPTLPPSEVAPYRCGSLLGRGSEPCPLQGPVIWPTSNRGHIALPPMGSKRLGPQYWADLITSPTFIVMKAADEFKDKTTAPNQLWQTDFTYLKVTGWGCLPDTSTNRFG